MIADAAEMTSCTKEINVGMKEIDNGANANTSCSEEMTAAQMQTRLAQKKCDLAPKK